MITARGSYATNADDFFKDSMIANQVRGLDSSGMFQLKEDGTVIWAKSGDNASTFMRNVNAQAIIGKVPVCPVTVGHVRAATMGDISTENSHPFKADREDGSFIIGVHNGTLTSWRDKPDASKFKVDSAWMMHMLAKEGADAFEYFSGAFAIVWYDSAQPESLFMARNKDRPLCYMVDDTKRSLVGCSELGMLGWLTSRNGLKLAKDGPFNEAFYLEEGKIYKFDLEHLGNFQETTYPKYDPSTSLTRPSQAWPAQKTDIVPWKEELHKKYASRNDDIWDDNLSGWNDEHLTDWDDYLGGYPPTAGARREMYVHELAEQENTLKAVKAELQAARYNLQGKDAHNHEDPEERGPLEGEYTVVDEDALDKAMHKAIVQSQEKASLREVLQSGEYTYLTIKTSSATKQEVEAAKAMGYFGRVVHFLGIEYDEPLSSVLGYFEIKEDDGTLSTVDGVIRFTPRQTATDLYIESTEGHLAIVVGYRGEDDMLILVTPTADEVKFINDMYAGQQARQLELAVN